MRTYLIITLMIAGLLFMPIAGYSQADPVTPPTSPSISQPLVREGDFAIQLAKAMGIGEPQHEADAETLLISYGIAPQNGWISDYPMTPDILGDLQNAIKSAADANRLPMAENAALQDLQTVSEDLGLSVIPGETSGNDQSSGPPQSYEGEDSTVINNYYDDYGPPVITYYPPPVEYVYLYAWVPYLFYFDGFFFTGYFCLHDFDRIVVFHREHRICTNHVFNARADRVDFIDPVTRRVDDHFRGERRFNSIEARHGAETIFRRSAARGGFENHDHRGIAEHSNSWVAPQRNENSHENNGIGEHRANVSGHQPQIFNIQRSIPDKAPSAPLRTGRNPGVAGNSVTVNSGHENSFRGFPGNTSTHGEFTGGFHGAVQTHEGSFEGFHGENRGHVATAGEFHGNEAAHSQSFAGFHGGAPAHVGGFHGGGGMQRR